MRRARLTLASALTAALVLAGCGGGDGDTKGDEATDAPSSSAPPAPVVLPLTGQQLAAGTAAPANPVLVAKIDNTRPSAPQVGLGKADLVVEELVEGGSTRLAVMYHSQIPAEVGPVRSIRGSDVGIVKPTGGHMVVSGGAAEGINKVRGAGISFSEEGAPGFFRQRGRRAPYNLFVRLPELARTLKAGETPPAYLPWGTPADVPAGQPATSIDARFSAGHTTRWTFQGGSYVNQNSRAAEGDVFAPTTVLVLRVQVGDAGYRDPAGNPVPETRFEGTGQALLFHGGKVVQGTWTKDGVAGTVKLSTPQGELKVPAGKVWLELVPANGGGVSFR